MKDRTRYMSALTAFVLLIGMASFGTIVTSQNYQPGGSNGTASGENVTITGTVTDGETGIAGAEIAMYGGDIFYTYCEDGSLWPPYWQHITETGDGGTFELELPAGNYSLNVVAEGFEQYYDWVEVDEGTELSIELIELTALMTGYVTSSDGDAVVDAYVSIYTAWDWHDDCRDGHSDDCFSYEENYDGTGCVSPDYEYYYFFAYTDDEGQYTLYGQPGEYEVSVWASGFSNLYDQVELIEGETEMDFVLETQSAYIEGWVYDETTSDPVGGALVTLEYYPVFFENGVGSDLDHDKHDITVPDDEIIFHYTAETDDEGWFEFELESDEMWMYGLLTVEARGYETYETDVFLDEHVQLRIMLEPENGGGGNGEIVREYVYEYIDEDSDGNPEYIYKHEIIHKGNWLVYEYEYIFEDEDSDGNPEYEYEWETGTKVEKPVRDGDRDPDRDPDDVDRDKVFKPLIPDDNGGKEVPTDGRTDPEGNDDMWAEGKGDQGSGTDVHTKGIAFVMTIALVGGAFLLLIRRR